MRDSLEAFEKTLEGVNSNWSLQNNLIDLIENLNKNLESERETTTKLQEQIQNLMKQDNFGITSKYVALKAECATLKEKLSTLKNENDDLHIQLLAKSEETKHLLMEKERELRTYYSALLKQKDEEIKQKDKEIQITKQSLQKREQELYNEIQAAEASSAIELDHVESNFKKQLAESNKKLKNSMETCNVLRVELLSVKEQFSEYKQASNQKFTALQTRFRESQNVDQLSATSSLNQDLSRDNTFVNTEEKSKYQPLDVFPKTLSSCDKPINLKKTPVYRGIGKYFNDTNMRKTKSSLPPLMDLKNSNKNEPKSATNKRRKLYDPTDLSYLNLDVPDKV
ncbi:myosin-1-like [Tribolium madens]|uniref:myosin-1-like n=1 Tax=Tribolium madens TaxID=41895 RepID=UPI001CF720A2|nr:myosin-1-like [Tribolium madens]